MTGCCGRGGLATIISIQDPYLRLSLQRIDRIIRREALRQRLLGGDPGDPYRGLLISDDEIDRLLQSLPSSHCPVPDAPSLAKLDAEIGGTDEQLAAMVPPPSSRLGRLVSRLKLQPLDRDILLLALVTELDPRYGRLFGFLQDDVTQSRPSPFLAMNLLCADEERRRWGRTRLLEGGPLMRYCLVKLLSSQPGSERPWVQRGLEADVHVVNYLLTLADEDPRLSEFVDTVQPADGGRSLVLEAAVQARLLALAQNPVVIYLRGARGLGRREAAQSVCHKMGRGLMVVDLPGLLASELSLDDTLAFVERQAVVRGDILLWEGVEALAEDSTVRRRWLRAIREHDRPTFIAGEEGGLPLALRPDLSVVEIPLSMPDYETRKALWDRHLEGGVRTAGDVNTRRLANRFRFGEGQMRRVVATARDLARGEGSECVGQSHFFRACRVNSNQRLSDLAQKVAPHYRWEDIVLPPDQIRQLREIVDHVTYRPLVYGKWGFDRKLALSKGVNALFVGGPGTGKTMAANILAGELGLDLYKIDLSMVVSKYIGETEKNLRRIFSEAATSNSILFFDEADAIFGKRSEVRDSHDRYANIEVAYLLQKMEEYSGIAILATNMRQSLDDAFVRRMHFTVEFPFPEEAYRRQIWELTFPAEAPRYDDVDLDFMARQFKVAGGNIRNIILSAAFLAAADGRVISMAHLIHAAKREFQKIGKLVVDADFGPYYRLLKDEEAT